MELIKTEKMPLYVSLGIALLITALSSCVSVSETVPDPRVLIGDQAEQVPQEFEATGSMVLDQALQRRVSPEYPGPNEKMITLGVLASAALNLQNNVAPDVLEIQDGERAARILSKFWDVESRAELLQALDSRITGGYRGLYSRILTQIAEGEIPADDDATTDFLVSNAAFIGIQVVNAYELSRLSSLVRWANAAEYLKSYEAKYLMEDIGLMLVQLDYDFLTIANGQMAGMALIYRSSNNRAIHMRDRALFCLELLEEGAWKAENWDAFSLQGREILSEAIPGLPDYAGKLHELPNPPKGEELDDNSLMLFDPSSESHSVLGAFYHEYQLFRGIQNSDLETVVQVIEQAREEGRTFYDTPPRKSNSWTGLAVQAPAILSYLLEQGFSPNVPHATLKSTALHWSVIHREPQSLEILLNHGADIEAKDKHGDTALMDAIIRNYSPEALRLIRAGANVNARRNNSLHPLLAAATHGNVDIVRALLRNGAPKDVQDSNGYNALFSYVNRQHFSTISELEEGNLDTNTEVENFAPDLDAFMDLFPEQRTQLPNSRRPLIWFLRDYASTQQLSEELTRLENQESDATFDSVASYSILTSLIGRNQQEAFHRAVKFAGDVNYRTSQGYHALYYACTTEDRYWAFEALLDAGADPNLPGYKDYSCLTAILADGEFEAAIRLIEGGADVNIPNRLTDRPMFTEIVDQVVRADLSDDQTFSLLSRVIDEGGLLVPFEGLDPEFWLPPFHHLTRSSLLELRDSLARYARAAGQDLGPELNQAIDSGDAGLPLPDPGQTVELLWSSSDGKKTYSNQDGSVSFSLQALQQSVGQDEDLRYSLNFGALDFASAELYLTGMFWQDDIHVFQPASVIELTQDASDLLVGSGDTPSRFIYQNLVIVQDGVQYLAKLHLSVPYSNAPAVDPETDDQAPRVKAIDTNELQISVNVYRSNRKYPENDPIYGVTARITNLDGNPTTGLEDLLIQINGRALESQDGGTYFTLANGTLDLSHGDPVTLTISHPSYGVISAAGQVPRGAPSGRIEPELPVPGVAIGQVTDYRIIFDEEIPKGMQRYSGFSVYNDNSGNYVSGRGTVYSSKASLSDQEVYLIEAQHISREDGSPYPYLRFKSHYRDVTPISGFDTGSKLSIESPDEWSSSNLPSER